MEILKYKLLTFATHAGDRRGRTGKENPIPVRPGPHSDEPEYQTLKPKIKNKGQHEIVMQ